jgi:hypothetical protein
MKIINKVHYITSKLNENNTINLKFKYKSK